MAAQGTAFIHATSLFPRNMSLAHLDAHEALINRKDFLNSLGIDVSSLVCCRQVHSPRLQCVGPADAGRGAFCVASAFPGTDALITGTQRLPLAVFTADCLPVFFFDPRSPAAGIAHAGWRGVHRGIIQAVVQGM
ncbi:MAG: laccase domain-containing protein, partial [Candidatus Omnitrophota bacterium]